VGVLGLLNASKLVSLIKGNILELLIDLLALVVSVFEFGEVLAVLAKAMAKQCKYPIEISRTQAWINRQADHLAGDALGNRQPIRPC
jgi:hypothetical protein